MKTDDRLSQLVLFLRKFYDEHPDVGPHKISVHCLSAVGGGSYHVCEHNFSSALSADSCEEVGSLLFSQTQSHYIRVGGLTWWYTVQITCSTEPYNAQIIFGSMCPNMSGEGIYRRRVDLGKNIRESMAREKTMRESLDSLTSGVVATHFTVNDLRVARDRAEPLPAGAATHFLKSWPASFEQVAGGKKPFELRLDDRGFAVGDAVVLCEWDPERVKEASRSQSAKIARGRSPAEDAFGYTGKIVSGRITFVLRGSDLRWLPPDSAALGRSGNGHEYVVLGIFWELPP